MFIYNENKIRVKRGFLCKIRENDYLCNGNKKTKH